MIITSKVNMNLQQNIWPPTINAVQGDLFTRNVEISLHSNGVLWTVPDGVTVAVRYCKPDKTKGYYDTMPDGTSAWSVHGNVITVSLAPQMLTVSGTVFAQVEMLKGNTILSTFSIKVYVEPNPAAGVLQSEDYINWLQWMEDELEVRMNEMLETVDFTGPPGPPATIVHQANEYQTSSFYNEVPSGEWSTTIPDVAQGEYLWTRITVKYNTGDSVVSYSVSRFGLDGSGAVSSVSGVSPDASGNVSLAASDVGAVNKKGDTMEGSLNMNGQSLTGLNAPINGTDAVNKGYADEIKMTASNAASAAAAAQNTANGKCSKSAITVSLTVAGWSSSLTQTVSVSGVTSDNTVVVSPTPASHVAYTEANVRCTAQASGILTFTCDTVPTDALTVNVVILT